MHDPLHLAAQLAGAMAAGAGGESEPLLQRVVEIPYLWLIPAFPLLGAAINACLGKRIQERLGRATVHRIAVGVMLISTAIAWVAFAQLIGHPAEERYLHDRVWNLFTVGSLRVDLAFALDPLSMMMTLVVTNIATLIHVFSIGYMHDEPAYWRYFSYLNLFVFSMLLLVMGDNFVVMFFGWEGVGLCSYLLISFWYEDLAKARAGMKAFVVNRIGDFGFILGLFALLWGLGGSWAGQSAGNDGRWGSRLHRDHYQPIAEYLPLRDDTTAAPTREGVRVGPTVSFKELHDQMAVEATGTLDHLKTGTFFGFPLLAVVCILLFVGAVGKSAQIPLYVWLPDAMAGPTPVSALIHAATMVTAGVYMVARLNFLFALSPPAMTVVAGIGALTAIFAASIGLFQYDIKKVLAYSTVSQLGFMFIGVGVGAFWAGSYHLLTHAFFKACLFLGSGSVILACHHEQDMRKMGGLREYTPLTRWTYALACVAISGFPVMSGFFSKDEILWKAFTTENLMTPWLGPLIAAVGIVAAGGTSFYMWRSYYLTFWSGPYRGAAAGHGHEEEHEEEPGSHTPVTPHESPPVMTYVLVALAAGAFLASFLGLPKAWTGRDPLLEQFLEPVTALAAPWIRFKEYGSGAELLSMAISVGVATVGWALARWMYQSGTNPVPAQLLARFPRTHNLIFNKYYVDEIYQATVIRAVLLLRTFLGWFDTTVIDGLVNLAGGIVRVVSMIDGAIDKYFVDGLVNLLSNAILAGGQGLRRIQTGRLENYLFGALAGALAFVAINYLVH